MNNFDKKRLNKMWEKIDSLAKIGKLGLEEYKEYLDEIVADGQFWIFQTLLARKYSIRDTHKLSLFDAKSEKIWNAIRFNTKSDFQITLKKLYNTNSCYQISKRVYSTTTNDFLGEIYQESTRGLTQSQDVDTLVVVKGSNFIRYDNVTVPMIDKYKMAIEYLKRSECSYVFGCYAIDYFCAPI